MLFSQTELAKEISDRFEPAWQSVRKAALVQIDFGNGKTVTRTLNGNIATYICLPDGRVLDVIPGIYDPEKYRERLQEAERLYRWATARSVRPRQGVPQPTAEQIVKSYHTQQAASLREHKEPKVIDLAERSTIFGIERNAKLVLKSSLKGRSAGAVAEGIRSAANRKPSVPTAYTLPRGLASRVGTLKPDSLRKDSQYNESVRRLQVHDYLAKHGLVTPDTMTKWLYKDVLHTDLDDPYLGLGKTLFSTYPFSAEDNLPAGHGK